MRTFGDIGRQVCIKYARLRYAAGRVCVCVWMRVFDMLLNIHVSTYVRMNAHLGQVPKARGECPKT